MSRILEVTEMFKELVRQGHVTPATEMEDLRLPGELPYIPSIATYGTPDVLERVGGVQGAELGQRP